MQHHEIHVIGGGLAGLTAAAFVARAGLPVVVHETRNRLGGRGTTDERTTEHGTYRFNQGPHALYNGGEGRRVLRELGIHPRGAVPPVKGVVVRDGRCFEAPGGPVSLLRTRLLGWREKLELGRFFATLPRRDAASLATTTVDEWLAGALRHERVREAVHTLVRLGTYANAPDLLSADVAVQQLQRSLDDGVTYLDHGWQQLVGALADLLADTPGVRIEVADAVSELPDAAAVIVAAGGPDAAGRLTGARFATGPAGEVACLDLGLEGEPPHDIALGVGEPRYLSKHSIAAGHAPAGGSAVLAAEYLRPGGAPDREGLEAFAATAGIREDRIVTRRYLHRMVALTGMPTAEAGGLRGRPGVAVPDQPGVFVSGDWVGPVGHLADASLASAREAARAAVAHVDRRPVAG